jgi:hypothetical protein
VGSLSHRQHQRLGADQTYNIDDGSDDALPDPGGSFVIDHAVPAASASDTTYCYAVTTVDADGDESPLSSELSPPPEAAPAEDNDTAGTNSGNYVTGDQATGGSGSGGSSGGAACFISTAAPTDASMTTSDFSISSIFGLLALIGLLRLGRKKVKGERIKDYGLRDYGLSWKG